MMPKSRPPYAPEFRRRMVDLVRAGREPEELAKEFETHQASADMALVIL
jgi:transposase